MPDGEPPGPPGARLPGAAVVAGVVAGWLLVGVVWGAQNSFGASLQGRPVALNDALRGALVQVVPWIPVTLAVIALTIRFPVRRPLQIRVVLLHAAAALGVAFGANVLVVLGYWLPLGRFDGVGALLRNAGLWTVLRLHIAVLIYAAIAALTQWALYHREARDRELRLARVEGQLARARLHALNAQLRPHFLFNTMHTIGQLWRSGQSDDADAVLDHLGSLFHRVQSSTASAEITLADELDLVRDYLAIEQARFRDRMVVTISAEPDALLCRVPPLILQPLVENAVRHGISSSSKAGRLVVTAAVARDTLTIVIIDDGPGMGASRARSGSGTGLSNTRERLAQLYGDAASLVVDSANGGGTHVQVTLPAREHADAAFETLHG